jgi:hypothetical protein
MRGQYTTRRKRQSRFNEGCHMNLILPTLKAFSHCWARRLPHRSRDLLSTPGCVRTPRSSSFPLMSLTIAVASKAVDILSDGFYHLLPVHRYGFTHSLSAASILLQTLFFISPRLMQGYNFSVSPKLYSSQRGPCLSRTKQLFI